MDYKTTLNLPKTDFPMKANLKDLELRVIAKWQQENIYGRLQKQAEGKKTYILHDGPPYANGHIHIGHALNKILKDVIVKFKTMEGFKSPYVPGWDCHGLPIEHQVLKSLGPKKEGMSQNEIRKLCREYAGKFIDIQRDEFKRLGVFGDWDNPYLTMNYRLRGRDRPGTRQVRRQQAACIKARSRCTGAVSTRPLLPRPRWSTRTMNLRRCTCGSSFPMQGRRSRRFPAKRSRS